jgi:nucleoside phosphorylase
MYLSKSFFIVFLASALHFVKADVGLLSFWIPELYALLAQIESEGNPVETHIFGGRKFYVTTYKGHNVVAVNTGVGISNSAATTAIMLQKFPSIDRIVGSGIAGGVVSFRSIQQFSSTLQQIQL